MAATGLRNSLEFLGTILNDSNLRPFLYYMMMSKLEYFGRPLVAFDPKNKDHRRWFREFQTLKTWGRCPVRFINPDENGDLITLCQRKLIDYYVNREFGKKSH